MQRCLSTRFAGGGTVPGGPFGEALPLLNPAPRHGPVELGTNLRMTGRGEFARPVRVSPEGHETQWLLPLLRIVVLWVFAVAVAHPAAGAAPRSDPDSIVFSVLNAEEAPSRGKFLIASRELVEPTFARRVVLLLDHEKRRGGIGLIINRPSRVPLTRIVSGLEELEGREDYIRSGGPVERNRLFMLIRADTRPPGTERILEDTYGSSTLDPLRALLASGEAQSTEFVVYAGYAGWAPGQLEAEIERGDWHVAPGRSESVFDADPAEVWPGLIRYHGGKWVEVPHPASRLVGAALHSP